MSFSDFVHLHVHSQYSLLDGTNRIHDLLKKAREYRMPALAITDHGNMFGAIEFYRSANKYGIKPIIGSEVYITPRSRFDKSATGDDTTKHLVLLVKNSVGFQNLIKLSTSGYLEGFYYRPRLDFEILRQHHEGLIGMSACLQGEIPQLIIGGRLAEARDKALAYQGIFGPGNFYLELMSNGIPQQELVNDELVRIGRELSIPLVASNDCHYLNQADAEAHEILLCIQTGKTIDDPNHLRFLTDQFYFRSPEEMRSLFKDTPDAIDNTIVIAEKCNLELDFGKLHLPKYDLPLEVTLDDALKNLSEEGLRQKIDRINESGLPCEAAVYRRRLSYELDVIKSMGFAGYFLIVWDFVKFARDRQIPVGPGRGSAAGSLVAYCLGITNIDPIRYGLFFERFLNPNRISMPDIDIDFCQAGREEVIKYVIQKYGQDKVCQIITFGKMQAKAVVRDCGRALGVPYSDVDSIAKLIPSLLNITLEEAIKIEPKLQEEEKKNERSRKLLRLSRSLEGLIRHSSTHAAGVVISDVPLVERIPLCRSPKNEVVTQYSMNDLQETGMTKFDFLGLKTLTVIKNALSYIRQERGLELDMYNIPLNDRKTFLLLHRAETEGVFQLESKGMKDILLKLKPDSIEDITALISLFRPGPMKMVPEFVARKHGRTEITFEDPKLKDIVSETYGVILYQEQVMQIASTIGGYTLAEADNLRKVMSKKKTAEMEKEKPKFLEGAKKNKIPEDKAMRIWQQMETFAEYGFNKSHSTAYAFVSYQTAYLKSNYPVEFMAALLTSEKDNRDNIIKYIHCAKEMGIAILPPDINESDSDFSISGRNIRFGLSAVKNVGLTAVEAIIQARETGGLFKSFSDFTRRADMRKINKRVVESLIKCGALDSTGHSRRHLFEIHPEIMDKIQKSNKKTTGRTCFFEDFDSDLPVVSAEVGSSAPELPEWDYSTVLRHEKETLGFYISGHPLVSLADKLPLLTNTDSASFREKNDKDDVFFAGVISSINEITTRKKDKMAYVTFEDMEGTIETIVFPDVYKKLDLDLLKDEPLIISGQLESSEEGVKVIVNDIRKISDAVVQPFKSIHFTVDLATHPLEVLDGLKQLYPRNRGRYDAFVHLLNGEMEMVVYLGSDYKFNLTSSIRKEAEALLGSGSIRFH